MKEQLSVNQGIANERLLLIRKWADELHACLHGAVWRDGTPAYRRLYALWQEMVAAGSDAITDGTNMEEAK